MATVDVVAQASSTTSTTSRSVQLPPLALALAPPPLPATSAAAAAAGAAAVVEEAEELVLDVVHFFQHSVEAVESTVHHLQVIHALERLEDMPLNQVVDLQQLKAAMHPVARTIEDVSGSGSGEEGQLEQQPTAYAAAAAAAAARLDSALDSVAGMRLREVVDVAKLADALQDVQYSGQLDSRALQREAIRLRRTVHWEAVAEAVRPTELKWALSALGSTHGGSPFSDMDIRAALAAVRMDAVRQVLSPPKPEQQRSHSLESSGMWTWESM